MQTLLEILLHQSQVARHVGSRHARAGFIAVEWPKAVVHFSQDLEKIPELIGHCNVNEDITRDDLICRIPKTVIPVGANWIEGGGWRDANRIFSPGIKPAG